MPSFPENFQINDIDINRRSFVIGALFWLVSNEVSAKIKTALKAPEIEPGFISKTEEYQEQVLSALPEAQKKELLSLIKQVLPDAYSHFINTEFEPHLLRIGYYHLYINHNLQKPTNSMPLDTITWKDIFFQIKHPFREPILIINRTFRVVFPKNIKKPLEPFDIISPENSTLVINWSYWVYDNEWCREYTYNWKPTSRFLKINHWDFIEMLPIENTAELSFWKSVLPNNFVFPNSIVKDEMPQCSQVARELWEKVGKPFTKWDSALNSLKLYPKKQARFKSFWNIPEQYKIADVFMNSKKHVLFWHRAFAFRENDDWFVIDPFSHKYIVPISNYRRKNDIIEIVVFT